MPRRGSRRSRGGDLRKTDSDYGVGLQDHWFSLLVRALASCPRGVPIEIRVRIEGRR